MAHTNSHSDQGTGKPLVFQHGLGASRLQIQSLLNDLTDVRLLTTDMPGHGTCELDPGLPPSFASYAEEVLRMMDRAGIYRAVAGGLSMGSGIALHLACSHPERLAGLILLRPAWLLETRPENLRILLDVAGHLENGQQKDFEKLPAFQDIQKISPEAAASLLGMFTREQPDNTSSLLRAMVEDQPCPFGDPPLITLPVLVIGNDHDPLHPWEMAESWHKLLPNSRLIRVAPRYLEPETHQREVIQAIREFMNQIIIN